MVIVEFYTNNTRRQIPHGYVHLRQHDFLSREYFLNNVTVNVGQPEVASGMAVREPLVIEA